MPKTLELSITGMSCDHCVRAITNAVEDLEGVKQATVSLETKSAVVEGEDLDPAKIIAAIEEEGYTAAVR